MKRGLRLNPIEIKSYALGHLILLFVNYPDVPFTLLFPEIKKWNLVHVGMPMPLPAFLEPGASPKYNSQRKSYSRRQRASFNLPKDETKRQIARRLNMKDLKWGRKQLRSVIKANLVAKQVHWQFLVSCWKSPKSFWGRVSFDLNLQTSPLVTVCSSIVLFWGESLGSVCKLLQFGIFLQKKLCEQKGQKLEANSRGHDIHPKCKPVSWGFPTCADGLCDICSITQAQVTSKSRDAQGSELGDLVSLMQTHWLANWMHQYAWWFV